MASLPITLANYCLKAGELFIAERLVPFFRILESCLPPHYSIKDCELTALITPCCHKTQKDPAKHHQLFTGRAGTYSRTAFTLLYAGGSFSRFGTAPQGTDTWQFGDHCHSIKII